MSQSQKQGQKQGQNDKVTKPVLKQEKQEHMQEQLADINPLQVTPSTKKPYIPPKLTHEGAWDTVTMQFGGSFNP